MSSLMLRRTRLPGSATLAASSPGALRSTCWVIVAASAVGCASSAGAPVPADGRSIPSLVVRMECDPCAVEQRTLDVIREGYASRRAQSGASESSGDHATLTIKKYSQRGVIRFLGPVGGVFSDAVEAELEHGGRRILISESARVPFQGMETVARRIGEKAADALMQ